MTTITNEPARTTIELARTGERNADLVAELRTAQLAAAGLVARLHLDDLGLWQRVDGIVAGLTATGYRLIADVTGEPAGTTAAAVPPVVRVRELATVQRRLFGALDRHPAPPAMLVEHTTGEVRRLSQRLRQALAATAFQSRP